MSGTGDVPLSQKSLNGTGDGPLSRKVQTERGTELCLEKFKTA